MQEKQRQNCDNLYTYIFRQRDSGNKFLSGLENRTVFSQYVVNKKIYTFQSQKLIFLKLHVPSQRGGSIGEIVS